MAVVRVLLGVAYPAMVYLALQIMNPRWVAALIAGLLLLRLLIVSPGKLAGTLRAVRWPALAVGIVLAVSAASNDPLALLLTPALINLALFASFARSLGRPETVIEALARVQAGPLADDENFSDAEVGYCRSLTQLWSAFFVLNGAVCAALAVAAPLEIWALYTGFVSYLLIGALFASEYVYRHWRFRRYVGAPTDVLLQRIFPPRTR
jgi:uncharacterized membrane protein